LFELLFDTGLRRRVIFFCLLSWLIELVRVLRHLLVGVEARRGQVDYFLEQMLTEQVVVWCGVE
jgi:hypothetical protein